MTVTRVDIVAAARKYLGRPLRHQGRIDAFDCVGIVLAVAEDLALADRNSRPILRTDYANYSRQPIDGFVHGECGRRLIDRQLSWPTSTFYFLRASLTPGDVLTLRLPTVPCHTAIVSELRGESAIVHAYSGARKVVEHRLDDAWFRRIAGVFSFPGVTT
jgi:hypothetical protein